MPPTLPPLGLLKLLSPLIRRFRIDTLIIVPVSAVLTVAVLLGTLSTRPPTVLSALLCPAIAIAFLLWGRTIPRVPDGEDVARYRYDGGCDNDGPPRGGGGGGGYDDGGGGGEDIISSTTTTASKEAEEDGRAPIFPVPGAPRAPERDDLTALQTPPPSAPLSGGAATTEGRGAEGGEPETEAWFRDGRGRVVLLRGVNLGGCCKIPSRGGDVAGAQSCSPEDVSFVGRPLPLDLADAHLARLRSWGYVLVRLLFTWEAVEHGGPGVYDGEYLNYLVSLIRMCRRRGISAFLDCHQDCWSRFTGGSGAPAWTLRKMGFDLDGIERSGAAYCDGRYAGRKWMTTIDGGTIPRMAWYANNARLAAGTMWTVFFAGDDFAPLTTIDGIPAGRYLQDRYCDMLGAVARAVREEPNVLGFDIMNEPSVGFTGLSDVRDISDNPFLLGWRVDAWTAMETGAGYVRTVDFFGGFFQYDGRRTINPTGASAWELSDSDNDDADRGKNCVWRRNGVWRRDGITGEPELLRPDHFARNPRTGRPVDFLRDYSIPFWDRATSAIRSEMPDAIIFHEPAIDMTDPGKTERPVLSSSQAGKRGVVWSKHFYDGTTLITGSFSRWMGANPTSGAPLLGLRNVVRSFGRSLWAFREEASAMGPNGGAPVLVGETGVPFNMRNNRDFADLGPCACALNVTLRAVEEALVSCTLWNYDPTNSNDIGDRWNGEDLSLYSTDHRSDPSDLNSGGRALTSAIRPYAIRTAGVPRRMEFDPYRADRRFIFSFVPAQEVRYETVIYLPRYHYPHGAYIQSKPEGGGEWDLDWSEQTLVYRHCGPATSGLMAGGTHTIIVTKIKSGERQ